MLSRVNLFSKELRYFSKFTPNFLSFNYYQIPRACFSFNPRHKPNDSGNNNNINELEEPGKNKKKRIQMILRKKQIVQYIA